MKRRINSLFTDMIWLAAAVIALFFFLGVIFAPKAHANGNPPPVTPPTTTQPTTVNIDVDAASKAAAAAQAAAKATAQAAANSAALGIGQGGAGGGGGAGTGGASDASSYSASGDVMNQNSSKFFVFPAPVWTQLPAAQGCFVSESHAGGLGWNFISGSRSIQFSDPICVSMRMAEAARLMCHFHTAEIIDINTFKTLFPGHVDLPSTPGIKNLSLADCEAIKRPRLVMTPTMPATPQQLPPSVVVPTEPRLPRPDRN